MDQGSRRVPFAERGGRLRGLLDLATGRYPAFLFGGSVDPLLPVFHLHEVTPEGLEPQLRYVAENGYRTVNADEISQYVRRGLSPGPRAIGLTFDDARASLWTVAAPLLRKYGLKAIAFAIPARVADAPGVRPTIDEGAGTSGDESDVPLATWPELRALHSGGTVDVQSHTWSHASIFCSARPTGFVTPEFVREHILNRPLLSTNGAPHFMTPNALGAPLYVRRSRMSNGRRFLVDHGVIDAATAYVAAHGGAAFFDRPAWRHEIERTLPARQGRFEEPADQLTAIDIELDRSRAELDAQLGPGTVRHLALPWGVAGDLAIRALRRGGYDSAYLENLFARPGVRPGRDPFRLTRFNGKFLRCLPGTGRQHFFSAV